MQRSIATTDNVAVVRIASGGSARIIIACGLGNALEWFDFVAYAMFATAIAKNFFPTGNELTSLLATFATFAVGFVIRPIGAVILGNYADRAGRKAALSMTILLMALGTAMIAVAPTYATIGIAAPILIVIARLLQGLSAGGEIGGAVSFLAEHAPPSQRGFFTAWQQASVGLFYILAGIVGYTIANVLTPQQIDAWGWRIPFVCGLSIAPVGVYIRTTLAETPLFARTHADAHKTAPWTDLIRNHFRSFAVGSGVVAVWAVCSQLINFMPTYTLREFGMGNSAAFLAFILVGSVSALSPLVGTYSDRVGRRPLMIGAALGLLVLAYPLFYALTLHARLGMLIGLEVVLAILLTLYVAPASAVLAELYPTRLRSTGTGFSYSVSLTLFGGLTPMISLLLIRATGNKAALAWYLVAAALVSLVALFMFKDRTGQGLE